MIRDHKQEQKERLSLKTIDQVFTKKVQEGLNCSPFECKALLEIVREVYLPWLTDSETIRPGQMMIVGVDATEPPGRPLSECKLKEALITFDAGSSDLKVREEHGYKGVTMLRRNRLLRIANEAKDQGVLLTAEDFAYKIFNCGTRTITRDLAYFKDQNISVPLRSQQKDIGPALTHRVQAVELYIQRKTYTQIAREITHSIDSIKNYINNFVRVITLTQERHSVTEIAFVLQISKALVKEYQSLYEKYNTPECRDRLNEIIAQFKTLKDPLKKGILIKKGAMIH